MQSLAFEALPLAAQDGEALMSTCRDTCNQGRTPCNAPAKCDDQSHWYWLPAILALAVVFAGFVVGLWQ